MMHFTPVIPPLPSPEGGSSSSPAPNPPVIPSFSPSSPPQAPAWMRGPQTQPGYAAAFPPSMYQQTPYLAVPTLPGQMPGSYYLAPTQLPPTGGGGGGGGGPPMAPVGPSGFSADWTGFPITTTVPPQGTPWQQAQSFPPQGAQQGFPPQGFPPQGFPQQGFPPQGYPGQGAQQGHPGTAFNMFQQPLPMGAFMAPTYAMATPFMGGGGMPPGWPQGAFPGAPAGFPGAGAAAAAPPPSAGGHIPPARGVSEGLDKFDKFSEDNCYGPVLDAFLVKVVKAHLEINPLLAPPPDSPSDRPFLKWNMLFPTAQCQRSSDPGHRSWAAGRYDPATWPRVKSLRLISQRFPWEIQIKAQDTAVGVTCQDVIEGVHEFMYGRISSQQLDNATSAHKRIVGQSYWHNRSTARDVPGGKLHNTLLRCDWLGAYTMFGGIVPVDERLIKEVSCGADLPCTFELMCVTRYPMSEDELRDHEAREAAGRSRRTSRATSRAPSRNASSRRASVHSVSSTESSSP